MGKYTIERDKKYLTKLREEILPTLPDFCEDFFVGISPTTTVLTRYNYATDLRIFFDFLVLNNRKFKGKDVCDISLKDMEAIDCRDIERFLDYLNGYTSPIDGEFVKNGDRTKARKLCAVRGLFKYLYNRDMISQNVTTKVAVPKVREKEIVRMENNEVNDFFELLDEDSSFASDRQNTYNNKNTKVRDNALITLMLNTGIRVSECVGLNVADIDFANMTFVVTRKGEKRSILYFNDEVRDALESYLFVRSEQLKRKGIDPDSEDALFLSLQNKRITVRAVEIIVKKYSSIVTPLKNITPHKLRSTYGTALYRQTNDIYVVAEVLGHNDINTTKKHYAAIGEDIKKSASDKVIFRNSHSNNDKS